MEEISSTKIRMSYADLTHGASNHTKYEESEQVIQNFLDKGVSDYIEAKNLRKHYAKRGLADREKTKESS